MRIELTESQAAWIGAAALAGYAVSADVPEEIYLQNLAHAKLHHTSYSDDQKEGWAKYNCLVWAQKQETPIMPSFQGSLEDDGHVPYLSMMTEAFNRGFKTVHLKAEELCGKMDSNSVKIKEGAELIVAAVNENRDRIYFEVKELRNEFIKQAEKDKAERVARLKAQDEKRVKDEEACQIKLEWEEKERKDREVAAMIERRREQRWLWAWRIIIFLLLTIIAAQVGHSQDYALVNIWQYGGVNVGAANPIHITCTGGTCGAGTQYTEGDVDATITGVAAMMEGAGNVLLPLQGTVASGLLVNVSNASIPVSGTFWQATQPVSGTFWQATQPVSGTFWQATQPVSAVSLPLPTGAATAALQTQPGVDIGDVTINNASIAVTGTFWQATQPISAVSLPLPTGAATAALQLPDSHNVTVDNAAGAAAVNVQDGGNAITVDWAGTAPPIGAGLEVTALRVTVATDSTGVLSVDDNGGELTVNYGSGTFVVGDGAGAMNVICDSGCAGGTQYAVDTALGATPTGTLAIAIRDDALSALTPVEGDAIGLRVDANGALWMIPSGTVTVSDGAGAMNVICDSGCAGGTQYAVDTALGATPTGTLAIAIRDDALSALTPVEGDAIGLRVDANGALWMIPSGTTIVGDGAGAMNVICDSGCAGGAQYTEGDIDATITGTAMMMEVAANTLQPVQGTVAGGLLVDITDTSVAVTGTFWQATQPVSGTFWQATQPVSGTFWQATQPVSGTVTADTELVAVAVLGDNTVNPTISGLAAYPHWFDGATWDRALGNSTDGLLVNLGTNNDVTVTSGTITTVTTVTTANLAAETTKVIGTVRNLGNVGAAFDAAIGAAPPANGTPAPGLGSGGTGGFLTNITVCDTFVPIDIVTATTTLIVTGVANRHVRICSIRLITAAANNVAIIAGTGATCGTSTAGMNGGVTGPEGENYAANGGTVQGSGVGIIMQTETVGDSVCIITSAATQLSGTMGFAIW